MKTIKPVASCLALSLMLLVCATSSSCKEAHQLKELWSAPETEINLAGFTLDGSKVLFVRKPHEPDGHEAESFTESELAAFQQKAKDNQRWADPEVVIYCLSDGSLQKVDYGWSPKGSVDGSKVYFIHQKKPITGHRVLAETQQGNELAVYDSKTGTQEIVAKPELGYFDTPLLSPDGKRLAFAICDATNGAWGGEVGINMLDVEKGTVSKVVTPAKHHDLHDLIGPMFWVGDKLLTVRRTPLKPGTYMSDSYQIELLNVSDAMKSIYSTTDPENELVFRAYANPDGTITVVEGESASVIDTQGHALKKNLKPSDETLSPNQLFSVRLKKGRAEIVRIKDKKVIHSFDCPAPAPGCMGPQFSWSADASKLLVVMDTEKFKAGVSVFDRSKLFLVDLNH